MQIVGQVMIDKINICMAIVFQPDQKVSVDTLDRLW